jgi:hypothetical protein
MVQIPHYTNNLALTYFFLDSIENEDLSAKMSQVDYHQQADYEIHREKAEKERLKRLIYEASDSQKDWVDTFKDGETRRYRFVYDERTNHKLKHFKEGDEGVMKYHFYVLNLDNPDQLKYGHDQEFLLAETHVLAVLRQLDAGNYDLEITRHGSGNLDTWYEVKPISA